MNGKCIDIGTIQAFLDGETAPALSLAVTDHVAGCQNCAVLMADAEEESSIVFSALDRECNSLVPTQRLWNKINESIVVEKSRVPFWERLLQSLSVFNANTSVTVAAGVLIVFTMFAAIWTLNSNVPSSETVRGVTPNVVQPNQPRAPESVIIATNDSEGFLSANITPTQARSSDRAEKPRTVTARKGTAGRNNRPVAQQAVYRETASAPEYLPGEESYVKTIADLKQNVDGDKDVVLPPSSRVAYERDMAVVDDAISKMKAVVRKNPNNQGAKQVLYSSYQNKIDLLNSVAQREEMMAIR